MTSKILSSLRQFNSFATIGRSFLVKINNVVYEARHSPPADAIGIGTYIVFTQGRLKDIGRVTAYAWLSEHRFVVSVDTLPNKNASPRDIFTINNIPISKITHVLSYYNPPIHVNEDFE